MTRKIFVLAALLVAGSIHAQQSSDTLKEMDEVVITASKYPRKQSETGKVLTVINRLELDRSGSANIGELLNRVAGVNIIGANSNPGTNLTTSIRGASAGNVLILIDGVPVNDPSVITNYYDLNFLAPGQIERIEIMKGGQSTLYGSDAVAGVINIITKKNTARGFKPYGSVMAGSFNTFSQQLGLAYRSKKNDEWNMAYTHLRSDGITAALDSSGNAGFDKDGFSRHNLTGSYRKYLKKGWQWHTNASYNQYFTDLDAAAFTDERDFTVNNRNLLAGTGVARQLDRSSLNFQYQFQYISRDYEDDSIHQSSPYLSYAESGYIGITHFAEFFGSIRRESWELLAGIDLRQHHTRQFYSSLGPFGPYESPYLNQSMGQWSPYASVVWRKKKFTGEIGSRLNLHSVYGSNITYNLNPSYLLNSNLKIYANLYSAFKAPTLYQLYDAFAGNVDLGPEISTVAEAGFNWNEKNFRVRVTGFYRNADNAIIYVLDDPSMFIYRYKNVSRQINYGTESELEWQSNGVELSASHTWTNGETRAAFDGTGNPLHGDTTYYNLYRIPKHIVRISAGWQINSSWFLRLQGSLAGERQEFIYGNEPVQLDAYQVLDLYAEYRFYSRFRAFIELKNLTDEQYQEIRGYRARPLNIMAGISFSI